jgi:hypothetical protein
MAFAVPWDVAEQDARAAHTFDNSTRSRAPLSSKARKHSSGCLCFRATR